MTHVEDLLAAAIKTQQFPYDPAAVYFVISDELVTQVRTCYRWLLVPSSFPRTALHSSLSYWTSSSHRWV
ncbi:hypothetical protein CLOP_g5663 [Closterium sp. NIES-67]|nr:hypothetical protein CLOP_g5663 [Closterium sp. NIES-67]